MGYTRCLEKKKKGKEPTWKQALSRIMIASLKMRHVRLRGRGDDAGEEEVADELRVCNVHLNAQTAKKDVQEGSRAFKRFWDLLARYLAEFHPSFLCIDANMALITVVPELRARGFQINWAAWYCWKDASEEYVRADSCGIFRLGPCQGVRICFDATVFGITQPTLPDNCPMVMEVIRDHEGKIIERRRYPVPSFERPEHGDVSGQGYPLSSYHPTQAARRQQFVEWTFTPVFDRGSPAVAGVIERARVDRAMFPFGADSSIGLASWSWPEGPVSEQKRCDYLKFDPFRKFFIGGAHMPLMVYVGSSKEGRRSKSARQRRAANADARGWTYARRMGMKKEKEDGKFDICVTHGGGASMVTQTNDTDLHQHVRKRFIESAELSRGSGEPWQSDEQWRQSSWWGEAAWSGQYESRGSGERWPESSWWFRL